MNGYDLNAAALTPEIVSQLTSELSESVRARLLALSTTFSGWIPAVQFARIYSGVTHRLVVCCSLLPDNRWSCVALETPKGADSTQQVFDAHAHKLLGTRSSPARAKQLCERYAQKWLEARAVAADCKCEEIEV